ncbi:MAG: hypothetical protein AAF799_09525 [Myxococcota bacterium]
MHESLETFQDSSLSNQRWNGTSGEVNIHRITDDAVLVEMCGALTDEAEPLFSTDLRHHVIDGASRIFFHAAELEHFTSNVRDSIFGVFRNVNDRIVAVHVFANPSSWPIQMGIKVGNLILKADVVSYKTNDAFIEALDRAVRGSS